MRGKNKGMSKAMALDTLGNAYLALRENFSTTSWDTDEGGALMDAGQILRTAFNDMKRDFTILDFTEKG